MDKRWKIEHETDNWTDEDFAAIWYMLYQNSLNSNGTNKALVTKRYCEIDERVKKRMYTILKR